MDISALASLAGSLARAGLPALGTILGTVLPPPFDIVAGGAFKLISLAMGVQPDAPDAPAQVQAAVEADPSAAVAKLQTIEDSHKAMAEAANEELRIRTADVQDARATEVKLAGVQSPLANAASVVATVIVLGFVGMLVLLAFHTVADTPLMNIMMGTLAAAFGAVVNFYLGSSAGSQLKDAHLADLARAPTVQAQPGSNVSASQIKGGR